MDEGHHGSGIRPSPAPDVLSAGIRRHAVEFDVKRMCDEDIERVGVPDPEFLQRAVTKRKLEFVAGRYCAARALAQLGWTGPGVDIGADRLPVWPAGFIGSISHTHGYAWAAAARRSDVAGVGIDSEIVMDLSRADNLQRYIVQDPEWDSRHTTGLSDPRYLTLVFSAKESLFKCLHPIVKVYFYFHAAQILDIDPVQGSFRYRLLDTLTPEFTAGTTGTGRFLFEGDRVHTAVVLPAAATSRPVGI